METSTLLVPMPKVRLRVTILVLLVAFAWIGPLLIRLMDWLVPWFGGDYKLWLRTVSDERVLAWQGNGEGNFRQNLEILEETTGLPVTRG
jgi:hypothetical protein